MTVALCCCYFSGANVSIVNERGHRPIMYAKDQEIKKILEEAEIQVTACRPVLVTTFVSWEIYSTNIVIIHPQKCYDSFVHRQQCIHTRKSDS